MKLQEQFTSFLHETLKDIETAREQLLAGFITEADNTLEERWLAIKEMLSPKEADPS